MRISKKTYYGLRAAIGLAQLKTPISAHDLANAEHIPEDFLEKILQKLKKTGIVDSKKGSEGGYFLAKPAALTSAWDILDALDAPFPRIIPPVEKGVLPCSIPSHCQTNEVWRTLEKSIEQTLTKVTLEKLITRSTPVSKTRNTEHKNPNKTQPSQNTKTRTRSRS